MYYFFPSFAIEKAIAWPFFSCRGILAFDERSAVAILV